MWYPIRPPSQHTTDPTIDDALLVWMLLILLGLAAVFIGVTIGLTMILRFIIYLPIKGIKILYAYIRNHK